MATKKVIIVYTLDCRCYVDWTSQKAHIGQAQSTHGDSLIHTAGSSLIHLILWRDTMVVLGVTCRVNPVQEHPALQQQPLLKREE